MNSLSKKAGSRPPLNDKLRFKISSLRQIQNIQSSQVPLTSYVDVQYILNNKRIKQSVIKTFLSHLYGNRFQVINIKWKQELRDEKIVEDVFTVKRKVIEEQWITENISSKRIKEKEAQFQQYLGKAKNKKDLNSRIKTLKDEMNVLGVEIDMCKKDSEIEVLKDKYSKVKQEYLFLINKNRRMNQLSEEKHIIDTEVRNERLIDDLQKLIEEKSNEKERKRYVEVLNNNNADSSSSLKTAPKGHQTGQKRILKLEQIFDRYAGKEAKEKMLFGEMIFAKKLISLENFLRMMGQTSIDNLLTNEEKVKIFKENSHYSRKIEFTSFVQALKGVCQKSSEKLKMKFTPKMLDMFLDEFISKIDGSSRLHRYPQSPGEQWKRNLDLKSKDELSKYRFKLKIHSGKFEESIKSDLLDRKNSKKAKLAQIKDKLTTLDCKLAKVSRIYSVQSEQSKFNIRPAFGLQPKKRFSSEPPDLMTETDKHSRSSKSNYAMIFQKKKLSEDKRKRQITQNSIPYRYDLQGEPQRDAQKTSNSIQFYSRHFVKKDTPVASVFKAGDEGLGDIIDDEGEDAFLTCHLQKKSVVIDDTPARKVRKIQF